MTRTAWHTLTADAVLAAQDVTAGGLSADEASGRLARSGQNRLLPPRPASAGDARCCVTWRHGAPREVRVEDLVPGDLVELELGRMVSADGEARERPRAPRGRSRADRRVDAGPEGYGGPGGQRSACGRPAEHGLQGTVVLAGTLLTARDWLVVHRRESAAAAGQIGKLVREAHVWPPATTVAGRA